MMMSSHALAHARLREQQINSLSSPIEPIKKVIPITPQRFRIDDQVEQPTFYLLEAKSGQTLKMSGNNGIVIAKLFSPSGQLLSSLVIHPQQQSQWQGSLSESGLYRVLVYPVLISNAFMIMISLSDV
jgi:hypothetical protein